MEHGYVAFISNIQVKMGLMYSHGITKFACLWNGHCIHKFVMGCNGSCSWMQQLHDLIPSCMHDWQIKHEHAWVSYMAPPSSHGFGMAFALATCLGLQKLMLMSATSAWFLSFMYAWFMHWHAWSLCNMFFLIHVHGRKTIAIMHMSSCFKTWT